jgi:transketolase
MTDTRELALRIRKHAVQMTNAAKSSHIASVLSIADILAVLYGHVMNYKAENPRWEKRDRFILSKGHAGAGVYAALAESGFFDKSILSTYCHNGSILSGHVSHVGVPGVELSTGSLGHGLSIAAGMAYSAKRTNQPHHIFTLLSDGECDEGSVWEAAMFAGHHQLDNMISIIDYNGLQSIDTTQNTLALEPFVDKWMAFGWNVIEVNGHDHDELSKEIMTAKKVLGKPICVLAKTTKGKGVNFMENSVLWHYRSPQGDEYKKAMEILGQVE